MPIPYQWPPIPAADPVISALVPNTAPPGTKGVNIMITGQNFLVIDMVFVDGFSCASQNAGKGPGVTATQIPLTWDIPAGSASHQIMVAGNRRYSKPAIFKAFAPPVLNSLVPNTAPGYTLGLTVKLIGNNFKPTDQVWVDGVALVPGRVTYVSATEIDVVWNVPGGAGQNAFVVYDEANNLFSATLQFTRT